MLNIKTAALAAIATLALCVPALAQDAAPVAQTVDLGSVLVPLISLFGLTFVSVVGWVAVSALRLAQKQFNFKVNQQVEDTVQQAARNAAGLALTRFQNNIANLKITTTNPAIVNAVKHMQALEPAAIKSAGYSPEQLAVLVLSHLPQVANTPSTTAPADPLAAAQVQ